MTDRTPGNEFLPPPVPGAERSPPVEGGVESGGDGVDNDAVRDLGTGDSTSQSEPGVSEPGASAPGRNELSPNESSPSDRGWWRRNRIALIAILILVPLTGLVIFGKGIRTSRDSRPTDPITVDAGQTATYSGATVGPTVAAFTNDSTAAPNSRVVRVTMPIANGSELFCNSLTLRELTGAGREWQPALESFASDGLAVPYCDTTQPGPYHLETYFVIPDDAIGPFAVELYVVELLPKYVKFVVNPSAEG